MFLHIKDSVSCSYLFAYGEQLFLLDTGSGIDKKQNEKMELARMFVVWGRRKNLHLIGEWTECSFVEMLVFPDHLLCLCFKGQTVTCEVGLQNHHSYIWGEKKGGKLLCSVQRKSMELRLYSYSQVVAFYGNIFSCLLQLSEFVCDIHFMLLFWTWYEGILFHSYCSANRCSIWSVIFMPFQHNYYWRWAFFK